jgi:hypothetical protein
MIAEVIGRDKEIEDFISIIERDLKIFPNTDLNYGVIASKKGGRTSFINTVLSKLKKNYGDKLICLHLEPENSNVKDLVKEIYEFLCEKLNIDRSFKDGYLEMSDLLTLLTDNPYKDNYYFLISIDLGKIFSHEHEGDFAPLLRQFRSWANIRVNSLLPIATIIGFPREELHGIIQAKFDDVRQRYAASKVAILSDHFVEDKRRLEGVMKELIKSRFKLDLSISLPGISRIEGINIGKILEVFENSKLRQKNLLITDIWKIFLEGKLLSPVPKHIISVLTEDPSNQILSRLLLAENISLDDANRYYKNFSEIRKERLQEWIKLSEDRKLQGSQKLYETLRMIPPEDLQPDIVEIVSQRYDDNDDFEFPGDLSEGLSFLLEPFIQNKDFNIKKEKGRPLSYVDLDIDFKEGFQFTKAQPIKTRIIFSFSGNLDEDCMDLVLKGKEKIEIFLIIHKVTDKRFSNSQLYRELKKDELDFIEEWTINKEEAASLFQAFKLKTFKGEDVDKLKSKIISRYNSYLAKRPFLPEWNNSIKIILGYYIENAGRFIEPSSIPGILQIDENIDINSLSKYLSNIGIISKETYQRKKRYFWNPNEDNFLSIFKKINKKTISLEEILPEIRRNFTLIKNETLYSLKSIVETYSPCLNVDNGFINIDKEKDKLILKKSFTTWLNDLENTRKKLMSNLVHGIVELEVETELADLEDSIKKYKKEISSGSNLDTYQDNLIKIEIRLEEIGKNIQEVIDRKIEIIKNIIEEINTDISSHSELWEEKELKDIKEILQKIEKTNLKQDIKKIPEFFKKVTDIKKSLRLKKQINNELNKLKDKIKGVIKNYKKAIETYKKKLHDDEFKDKLDKLSEKVATIDLHSLDEGIQNKINDYNKEFVKIEEECNDIINKWKVEEIFGNKETPVKPPVRPSVKAPVMPPVKSPGGPPVKSPGGPPVKSPGGSSLLPLVKSPVLPTMKPPVRPSVKPPSLLSVHEPKEQSVYEPEEQSIYESIEQSVRELIEQPVKEPIEQPVEEPIEQPVEEPDIEIIDLTKDNYKEKILQLFDLIEDEKRDLIEFELKSEGSLFDDDKDNRSSS